MQTKKQIAKPFLNNNPIFTSCAVLMAALYLATVMLTPTIKFVTTKKNTTFANKINNANGAGKISKPNAGITITTTTSYVNTDKMLARQINNNNLQSYIHDAKGSVLKLNDSIDSANNQTYSYDAYGNIISSHASAGLHDNKSASLREAHDNTNSPSLRAGDSLRGNLSLNNTRSPRSLHSLAMTKNMSFPLNNNSVSFPPKQESTPLTIPNHFQYNGEFKDNNTKLIYLRARHYNPETKRFLNQDSYSLLNRFGYVNANPVMYLDPMGHDAWDWIKTTWHDSTNWIADKFKNDTLASSLITGGIGLAFTGVLIYGAYRLKKKYTISKTANASSSEITSPSDQSSVTIRDMDLTQADDRQIKRDMSVLHGVLVDLLNENSGQFNQLTSGLSNETKEYLTGNSDSKESLDLTNEELACLRTNMLLPFSQIQQTILNKCELFDPVTTFVNKTKKTKILYENNGFVRTDSLYAVILRADGLAVNGEQAVANVKTLISYQNQYGKYNVTIEYKKI